MRLNIDATVNLGNDDLQTIQGIANLNSERNKRIEKSNDDTLRDRGRALDQVKRLYAVIIAFAVTSSIANAIKSTRKVLPADQTLQELGASIGRSYDLYLVLLAQVLTLLSLVALYYLSAERMLDRKYLQRGTLRPPSRGAFFGDLFTIGAPALIFFVMGSIFPSDDVSPSELRKAIVNCLFWFSAALFILYVLDICLLALHGGNLKGTLESLQNADEQLSDDAREQRQRAIRDLQELKDHYRTWIRTNLFMVVLTFGFALWLRSVKETEQSTIAIAATILIAAHVVRFYYDYRETFSSYFPTRPLENVG